jgi:hypothetical protein
MILNKPGSVRDCAKSQSITWRRVCGPGASANTGGARALLLGLLTLLSACGDDDTDIAGPAGPQGPGAAGVSSFEAPGIGSAGIAIPVDGNYTLRIVGRDAQGNAVAAPGILSSSSNPSVASVSSGTPGTSATGEPHTEFTVQGGSEGAATLTFRDPSTNASFDVPVRVSRVSGLTCCGSGGSSVTLQPGSTQTITVQATDGQGNALANVDIGASSTNPAVVLVSGANRVSPDAVQFTVTGVVPGTAGINLTGGGAQQTVQVEVTGPGGAPGPGGPGSGNPVTGIEVDGSTGGALSLNPSEAAILTARATDSQGSTVTGAVITASSSNPGVVTVTPTAPGSNQFSVLGLTPGTATITFRDQTTGTEESVNVTVS